ncbi:MAG TPA: hypothetical protein VKX28_29435 [Xanthobacteraceae bacterium]|nr:hypothetical protein [Xanthobacteraceae bacterium]
MRTPDRRKHVRELYALAKATPHADDGLVYVMRAIELEAESKLPGGPDRRRAPGKRLRRPSGHAPATHSGAPSLDS